MTVVVLQFGRGEGLSDRRTVTEFGEAYKKLLDELMPTFRNVILVTPMPFEKGDGLMPNLSKRNSRLAEHANVIRELARERSLPLIDLFGAATELSGERLTSDGLQFTPAGQSLIARLFMHESGAVDLAERVQNANENGVWLDAKLEKVRQAVIAKNRLWFDYSRPQNWAFLGGDRTTQPSSRDHRDPKVRWFPNEMEKFLPLIAEAEKRIEEAASR